MFRIAAIVLMVGFVIFIVVEHAILTMTVSTTQKLGYAGEAYQIHPGTQYRVLYFQPQDMSQKTVLVAGTYIQEDAGWTSIGYMPQKGDLVQVNEVRLFGLFGVLHGWGNTILIQAAPKK